MAKTTTRTQTPFHYGLFYYAMLGLVGRAPDESVRCGFDGFYDFIYKPMNAHEQNQFPAFAETLRKWLDLFDITFSGSFCGYTKDRSIDGTEVLRIIITHPVTGDESM